MAIENYQEMRDSVRDPGFLLRKQVAFELERRLPDQFVPRYSMVMFRDDIGYAEAQRRGVIQARILQAVTEDRTRLEDCDLDKAAEMVVEQLAPIDIAGRTG